MGCVHSRDSSLSIEKNYFDLFEQSLGLSQHTCSYLDRIFYRFSKDGLMTHSQFKSCCKHLSINRVQHQKFFNYFKIDENYSASKLSCLGILLGSGKSPEKILLLFQNFDADCSNTLNSEEVIEMIDTLILIGNTLISEYVSILNPDNEYLKKYSLKLKLASRGYSLQISKIFLDNLKEISFKTFLQRFREVKYLKKLLTSKSLRKLVSMEYQKYTKQLAYADYLMKKNYFDDVFERKRKAVKKRSNSSQY